VTYFTTLPLSHVAETWWHAKDLPDQQQKCRMHRTGHGPTYNLLVRQTEPAWSAAVPSAQVHLLFSVLITISVVSFSRMSAIFITPIEMLLDFFFATDYWRVFFNCY